MDPSAQRIGSCPLTSTCSGPQGDDVGDRGIALVAVLWILALLATLVLGFVIEARTDLRIVRNSSVWAYMCCRVYHVCSL